MSEPRPASTLPFDAHDRELVANVHPPDWKNPEPQDRYHLVVIGAGTGGLVTAAGAASLGAKVALVERNLMGGDCLNVGCVPSKGVIRAARGWASARGARADFGGPEAVGEGDFAAAMERMRRLRARLSPMDGAARFRDLGVDVFLGSARFEGPDAVRVDAGGGAAGEGGGHGGGVAAAREASGAARLRFRRAVIATGARAAAPPIEGLEEAGYLTNETVFTLTERPARLAVIGAGPIGCELAQAFARLGSRVEMLDQGEHMLPREDPDAAAIVQRALERDGVRYAPGVKIARAERGASGRVLHYTREGRTERLEVDEILVGAGRAPNVEGLGLDAAGVRFSRRGVDVDPWLRTSNRRVYAAGDVCSRYKFTHVADAHARKVIANALFFGLGGGRVDRLVVPWCTYTSPEVAHAGLYAREAAAAGYKVDTVTVPLDEVDRAVLDGGTDGFLRVHLKKGGDRILGATLVSEHAGETISELTVAIQSGLGLGRVGSAIHPYPTQAEVIRRAADALRRRRLTPRTRRLFDLFFRLLR